MTRTADSKTDQERILSQLLSDLKRRGVFDADRFLEASMAPLRRQNLHSSRSGALISLKYERNGQSQETSIWAKKVKYPKEIFESMLAAYSDARTTDAEPSIPMPYSYLEEEKLLFMEAVNGTSLLERTLTHGNTVILRPRRLLDAYRGIGDWLQRYHRATSRGATSSLSGAILETQAALQISGDFDEAELRQLAERLEQIADSGTSVAEVPLVRPHNDFTLRNILLRAGSKFSVIDWDATAKPSFPRQELCWWDLTTFVLNLQSLIKVWPAMTRSRTDSLCRAFLNGYFLDNREIGTTSKDDFLDDILFVFTLRYWLKVKVDRSMWRIYSRHLGGRYVSLVRSALLDGRAYLLDRRTRNRVR